MQGARRIDLIFITKASAVDAHRGRVGEEMVNDHIRMTVLIAGDVQGVGFRAFTRRHALDMDLSGYAENLDDGRVEIVAEGERGDLEALLHQLKRGPAHAEVEDVDVSWGEGGNLEGFHTY